MRVTKSTAQILTAVAASVAFGFAAPADVLYNPVVSLVGDGATIAGGVGVTTSVQLYQHSVAGQAAPISSQILAGLVNTNSSVEGLLKNNPGVADAATAGASFVGTTYLYSAGYTGIDGTAAVTTTANRVVGAVTVGTSSFGSPSLPASQPQNAAYTGSTFRGAVGDDSATNFWTAGTAASGQTATAGWRYFNTNTQLWTTTGNLTNKRSVQIRSDLSAHVPQLFGVSSSGSAVGIYAIGSGTPTSSGQTATPFITTGASADHAPDDFVLFKDSSPNAVAGAAGTFGYNVAYLTDDGSSTTKTAPGIEKWIWNGSAWSLAYTILASGDTGYIGIAGQLDSSNGTAVLYAVSAGGARLNQFSDLLDNTSATVSSNTPIVLATAATNDVFRGVALAPTGASTPEPASGAVLGIGAAALIRRRRLLSVSL